MALDAKALQQLSPLLDQALDLAPAEQEAWLAALAPEHQPNVPMLRELLARQAAVLMADFAPMPDRLRELPQASSEASPIAASREPVEGALVGPYRLQRLLGQGGMGSVWLAERADGVLQRQVALKLPHLGWTPGLAERFAREREILAALAHPHIARLYDAGFDEAGRPWMALEYVEGEPIDVHARRLGLPAAARVRLLLQVAEAVAFAHARLVLHRDLKPSNLLVTHDGQVRLLDFGIAKLMSDARTAAETELTREAGRVLTLAYASPEQVRGEAIGTASDVYSLGVVAYELLAGCRPYELERGTPAELEEAIATQHVPAASRRAADAATRRALRGDLDAILHQALSKSPEARYATVDALAADWRRWLEGERVLARADSLALRAARLLRRHRWPLGAAAVVVAAFALALGAGATALVIAALLAGLAAAMWQARRAREQAARAGAEAARAEAVKAFVLDIFRANSDHQADPAAARATTARELLDRGAARVDAALSAVPEARAEMLETLAELYYQLQLDEEAADLDGKLVALLRQLHGPDDRRVASALIHMAGALHATSRREEILPALEEARRILDACGEGPTFTRAELLSRLAQRHYNVSKAKSIAYANQAVEAWRQQAVPDPDHLAAALTLAARIEAANGALAQATEHYREALAELLKLKDSPQVSLQEARLSLAEILVMRLQTHEGLALAEQGASLGLAALGEDSPSNIAAHSRWGMLLHVRGQGRRGLPLVRRAHDRMLVLRGEADTMYVPIVRGNLARCLYAEGRLAEALELAQAVNRCNRVHYAASLVLAFSLRSEGTILAALGCSDDARAAITEALAMMEAGAEGVVQRWRFNRLRLDLARLEVFAGRPETALLHLAEVVPAAAEDIPLPQPELVERDVLTAMARLLSGDGRGALDAVRVEDLRRLAELAPHPFLDAEAACVCGAAWLALGDPASARPELEAALALRRAHHDPSSPWLAEAEALLGRCRLALGDRAAAAAAQQRALAGLGSKPQATGWLLASVDALGSELR